VNGTVNVRGSVGVDLSFCIEGNMLQTCRFVQKKVLDDERAREILCTRVNGTVNMRGSVGLDSCAKGDMMPTCRLVQKPLVETMRMGIQC
jgi:hypothetical protein